MKDKYLNGTLSAEFREAFSMAWSYFVSMLAYQRNSLSLCWTRNMKKWKHAEVLLLFHLKLLKIWILFPIRWIYESTFHSFQIFCLSDKTEVHDDIKYRMHYLFRYFDSWWMNNNINHKSHRIPEQKKLKACSCKLRAVAQKSVLKIEFSIISCIHWILKAFWRCRFTYFCLLKRFTFFG